MKNEKIHNLEWISKNQVDLKEEQKILNNHDVSVLGTVQFAFVTVVVYGWFVKLLGLVNATGNLVSQLDFPNFILIGVKSDVHFSLLQFDYFFL